MPLVIGTRVGPYEVVGAIGAGGMGEVYRARDTTLGRDVAIKILPPAFTSDPERLARFEREARMLAALNHPHIGAIYGVEQSEGVRALVLELVEGDTLAARVERGPMPVADALAVARQIAEALDAAHEKGIVHRDLKPANIKITPSGVVKVLDLGLAKAAAATGDGSTRDLSQSPTVTVDGTRQGVILGTAAYMSPEQARGQDVDKRTDLWAFGCVLYEMLTGRAVFAGGTVSDTIARILEREPDWSLLPAATPSNVRRLLQRCLEKDARRRLRDIGDARIELDEAPAGGSGPSVPASPAARRRGRDYLGWAVAAILLIGAGATLARLVGPGEIPAAPRVVRTVISLPEDEKLATGDGAYPLAVSLDGSMLAYVAEHEGRAQLYIRALSDLEPKAIPGSNGAAHPFFSPDGQWVGFFAGGALQKSAVAGGVPLRICNVPGVSVGASWGPDDTIVLAIRGAGLFTINAAGGALQPLADSSFAEWPEILPDGKTVLFTTGAPGNGDSAFATMPLGGGARRIVARMADSRLSDGPAVLGTGGGLAQARFVSTGHLVYGQSPGIVRVVPVDPVSLSPTGSSISLVDSLERARNGGGVYSAISRTGLLVYASTGDRHQLVWVDRSGIATPLSADRAAFRSPRVSPDGTRVVIAINDETRRSDIWIYDAERGTKNRLTTERHNLKPVWTPDGTAVTFNSGGIIVESPADGTGTRRTLLSLDQARDHLAPGTAPYPADWSPDGRDLLFQADEQDLWVLPRAAGSAPRALLARPSNDYYGNFSPDGRWVVYVSDDTGQSEVYLARYPDLGSKVTISIDGGTYPRWSRDGRELFYRHGDAMMAVSVDTNAGVRAAKPQRLFTGPFTGAGRDASFDVAPGGRRFVMVRSDEASTLRQLTVVQNWFQALKSGVTSK